MKLLTRTAFVFLTAFVLLTAAFAGHSDTDIVYAVTGGNIYFDAATGTVTDCDSKVTEAVIPAEIAGIAVTSIGEYAFFYTHYLTSITIPYGIITIGNHAFDECGMTSITIPNSVISIGNYSFNYCNNLTSVVIPDSVISIGEYAFQHCENLTTIEIGNGVSSIGDGAFPNSLVNISVKSNNQSYSSKDGILFNKDKTQILCYPANKTGTSYSIPNSVVSIGDLAFWDCGNLTNIEIPDSVTSLGYGAFSYCTNLPSIKIPCSVSSIGEHAFYRCFNLIGVEIPSSVISMGENAFTGYYNLCNLYYAGNETQWNKIVGVNEYAINSNCVAVRYNSVMPEILVISLPRVNEEEICMADLKNLTEISVPVSVSAKSAVSVTICVPFFEGGKFVGMGFVAATVDKNTSSVTVPVMGNVSGAGKLNVIFLDTDFRPLSAAAFDIAA